MEKMKKEYFRESAEHVKKFIQENGPLHQPIVIYYIKKDEKAVKRIYGQILGPEGLEYIKFKERPMSETEKKNRLILWGLRALMAYVILVAAYVFGMAFFGFSFRVMDLVFYLGNIGGVACSLYVLTSGWTHRSLWMVLLGIVLLLLNSAQVARFLFEFM